MSLSLGSRLGTYQIVAAIGAGGMGEVYRARDTKLDRDVAIKVLPDAFARDASRMARFGREAKVLAALDHPNIAAIYGLEDSGDTRALVMQLAEGPTLAERIARGPIPIEEALSIARQIAEALEYAHERGIIHRDLKPANVKVAADDTVKVLDFGLAKAVEPEISTEGASNSPTLSRMATQAGVLLGTAAYMAPEQAKGKAVDRRADIWAFGCVLYEMLTGKMAFQAETVTEILAAVIKEEPDWSRLPAATPMRVRVLLQRCLQKDARQRLRDIGDARISLDEDLAVTEAVPRAGRHTLLFSVGALVVGAGIAGLAVWKLKPSPSPPRPVTRFTITLPPDQQLAELPQPVLALSPDGSKLAYVAIHSAIQQIYLRAMDSTDMKAVTGTEGATNPFFSPDGQWLGFFADGRLKKISVRGGSAQTLADAVNPRGASWGNQGTIVFNNLSSSLLQVLDSGGTVKTLDPPGAPPIPGELSNLFPEFLPGSSAVVFSTFAPNSGVVAQRIGTGERRNLVPGQPTATPRYASSGHLLYVQGGNLMAVPFDLERLQVTGTGVPVVRDILELSEPPAAQYSISLTGSLAYISGSSQLTLSKFVWVSRAGVEEPLAATARLYDQPRLSPDGKHIAVNSTESGNPQVWLYDIGRENATRFTYEGSSNQWPVWTSDGKRIVFQSSGTIFWQLADGNGGLERLTDPPNFDVPMSASPDGHVSFIRTNAGNGAALMTVQTSDRKTQLLASNGRFLDAPQFSPDGHWLAYASDESGGREIYVQPYPGPGGKRQISTGGGTEPQWNPNGRELFYRDGDKMMAVDISTQDGFSAGKSHQLFQGHYLRNGITFARPNYDVSRDGQRFLMLKPIQEHTAPTQINVVLNWTEELKRLVPTGSK
jgi:serine/threonine-protein kinase